MACDTEEERAVSIPPALRALLAAFACGALPLVVQAADPPARPKVGLVLSGGGARGLAHIGVLKVLAEQRVSVDFIVATSMGSIVGGAYAAGHTPAEMEALVRGADWDHIFSDRGYRENLSFRRKEDDLRLIGKSELGLKRDGVVLPRGALGVQNLEEFLRNLSRPASDARTLDDLPIMFRAVATDLVTAEQVVLSDVPLFVAMRASMSIPGAFAPIEVDGRLLGDGGLVRNLPVQIARDMGADVIVAVNVGTPLLPRERLSSAFGIAQQMINILTEQNVGISLAALRPTDILISPDLTGVSFVDFERADDLIERGEAAGRLAAARLAELSVPPPQYAAWESVRTRRSAILDRPVFDIVVRSTVRSNPRALQREAERAGVVVGAPATDEQLIHAGRILHGLGDFERVDVTSRLDHADRRIVVIDVDEKPWGPDYLRFGGRAVADFQTDARFSFIVQHTRTWVDSWGAEWRNEIQVGDARRFATSFYQPLGPGSPWFVEGTLSSVKSDFDIFDNAFRRTDRVTLGETGGSAAVGSRLGSVGVARAGIGHSRYRTTPLIGTGVEGTTKDNARFAFAGVTFDTLDDPNFPRYGYLVSGAAATHRYRDLEGDRVQSTDISAMLPITFGRLTLLGLAGLSRSADERGGFALGGFLDLSGTPVGAITGSHRARAAALLYYRMGELPRTVGRNWYLGFSLEAGNVWARKADVDYGNLRKAGSLFLGVDSILGPLYLGYGKTAGGDSALYLFWGRPADRLTGN
jgi:NTE family protein